MSQRIQIPWKTFAKVVAKLLAVTIGIGAAVLVIAWLAGAFEDKIARTRPLRTCGI